jgi:ABC-type multidrug transport system ATPase subunit
MLSISNLSKTYPDGTQALVDVSLEIPRGMFGLLGQNGAGKSTLMRTIATLQEADSGAITFDGIDVLRQKEEVRKVLGYLPQDFGLYPKVTAEVMLDHFALLKGLAGKKERKEVVTNLLRRTDLWEVRNKRLGTFSGGMRQRFGIAQALLGDPKLIIVDEPTAGLDPQQRNIFLNLLSEIGENVVVILSTHIVEDVSDLCSRMAILADGRVVAAGAPRDVVAELRGAIWQKELDKRDLPEHELRHRVISTRLVAGRPLIHVFNRENPGDGFQPVEPDLEDVFFFHNPPRANAAAERAA